MAEMLDGLRHDEQASLHAPEGQHHADDVVL
ncbi:hypothetical protein EE612_041646 [Oryza sativa]|nr:hypothetical protein EE612_041646 [Oryza sativa]